MNDPRDSGTAGTSSRHARGLTVAAGILALLATLVVVVVEDLRFAERNLPAHVAMETLATVIAGLAAVLFYGRARRTGSLSDILLAATLALLAVVNLAFSLVPAIVGGTPGRFATWAPVAGRGLGAIGFVAAALVRDRPRGRPARDAHVALAASAGMVALIAAVVALLGDALPPGVAVEADPAESGHPNLSGPPVIVGLQLAMTLTYTAAAVGFVLRAERTGESRDAWLAIAMALAAGSRLNYFLYPSLYSEYVYVGDILRVASYLALMLGASVEILAYERRLAHVAVLEERRRMARDLHDGLAQELSYITSQTGRLAARLGDEPALARIAGSAERALRESREAISALSRPVDETLEAMLDRTASVAARGRADVEVSVASAIAVRPEIREAMGRIAAEATANAVRHGGAECVRIEVTAPDGVRLRVDDDGSGFDPKAPAGGKGGGFGLISMRERAERLGGEFSIVSRPGAGAAVEVRFH